MKKFIQTGIAMLFFAILLSAASAFWFEAHAAAAAAAAAATSSGGQASESRPVDAKVVHVVMSGPIDLILRQAATPELYVKGDPKLVSRVTTRIDGNTLYVGTRGIYISVGPSEQTRIELSLPAIEKVQFQGSGDGNIKGFKGNRIELVQRGSGDLQFDGDFQQVNATLSGSGDLQMQLGQSDLVDLAIQGSGDATLKGQTRVFNVKLMGAGDLNAYALKSGQLSLDQFGSSDSKVSVSDDIRIKLMGSGDIHILGNPAKRQIQKIGSGELYWK